MPSLRISESLDLDTVLEKVVEGARLLTGANQRGLTVVDSGQLQDFITSSLTEEEHQGFVTLAGGPALFTNLSSLPESLRLSDFSAYTTTQGFPGIGPPLGPLGTFLCTSSSLRSARVVLPTTALSTHRHVQ